MSPAPPYNFRQECLDDHYVFYAKSFHPWILKHVLNNLHFKKDHMALLTFTQKGITLTIEDAHVFQCNIFLQREIFQEFCLLEPTPIISLNFSALMQCLSIINQSLPPDLPASSSNSNSLLSLLSLPNAPEVQIAYRTSGHPFFLVFKENDYFTKCSIRTMEMDQSCDFSFTSAPVRTKLILEAKYLRDAFNELDWNSSLVNIFISPDNPFFQVSTDGPWGCCQTSYPKSSNEVFEEYSCETTQSFDYKLHLLHPLLQVLSISKKAQLRMNENGTLCIQLMISHSESLYSYIDFYLLPCSQMSEWERDEP